MNLQFESLAELTAFLAFAGFHKVDDTMMVQGTPITVAELEALAKAEGLPGKPTGALADWTPGTPVFATVATAAVVTAAKKRRTKAEREADEVAAKLAAETAQGGVWPFGDPSTAGAASTEAATGETAVETPAEAGKPLTDHTTVEDAIGAAMYIAGRAKDIGEVNPVAHLAICRNFIATHQMSPYIRSMQLFDGPGDVAAFSDTDRVHHVAAMEYVNKALGKAPLPHETATH